MRLARRSDWWLLSVCTVTHIFVHVFTMMYTALIPVFMRDFNLTIHEAGLLVSVPQLISIMLSLPYGFIADRVDPRKLMAASLLVAGFSGLLASHSQGFIMLLASATLVSFSSTVYHPPALKVLSENFMGERQSRVLGIHGAGGTTGVAIGPITLGLMLEGFGWRFAYMVWGLPVLLSALLTFSLPYGGAVEKPQNDISVASGDRRAKSENHGDENSEKYDRARGYMLLLLATGINSVGQQALSTYMTTYLVSARKFSEANASLLFGLSPFIGIIGSLAGGYFGGKIGNKHWITIAYVGTAFSHSAIWFGSPWIIAPSYLMGGFFGGSTLAPSTTLVARYSSRERRGLAYTIFMLSPSIVGSVSPLIAAWLVEEHGFTGLFPFTISLTLLSTFVLQTLPKEEHEPS